MLNWAAMKNKDFSCNDALKCILIAADGNFELANTIIGYLSNKRNTYGRRGHCYVNGTEGPMDIVRNSKGGLKLIGFDKDKVKDNPLPEKLKGQHIPDEKKNRGRKDDGSPTKLMSKTKSDIENLRDMLFDMFPETNNREMEVMSAIRNYAIQTHYSISKVIRMFREGKLKFDVDNMKVVGVKNKRPRIGTKVNLPESRLHRIIRINENVANQIYEQMEMTEYKFNNAIKKFLHDLLEDPVNAKPPLIMQHYGYQRYKLITILKMNNMLLKQERIVDKDSDGNPVTAKMKVKFMVPKKNFERKLRNLYIKLFEKNIPEKVSDITECEGMAGGGAMSGDALGATATSTTGDYTFTTPVFGGTGKKKKKENSSVMRREIYQPKQGHNIDEDTTTFNTGDYTYTAPLGGDKETLSRRNGKGGSTSIPNNKVG